MSNYLAAGAVFKVIDSPSDNIGLGVFGGLQPEVTLLERLIVSVRLGLQADVLPEVVIGTFGAPLSIVSGANFKLKF